MTAINQTPTSIRYAATNGVIIIMECAGLTNVPSGDRFCLKYSTIMLNYLNHCFMYCTTTQ